ncbi:hypothetical protein [Ketogulonicigenium vulgare]|uniref:hypothetical protein n=1 Tax=Ketogulonicigenium vulgare TaxID=92945 RepID=UPI002359374A|nr:hypothetical protein [Ketogulonicigenium vulgare]
MADFSRIYVNDMNFGTEHGVTFLSGTIEFASADARGPSIYLKTSVDGGEDQPIGELRRGLAEKAIRLLLEAASEEHGDLAARLFEGSRTYADLYEEPDPTQE